MLVASASAAVKYGEWPDFLVGGSCVMGESLVDGIEAVGEGLGGRLTSAVHKIRDQKVALPGFTTAVHSIRKAGDPETMPTDLWCWEVSSKTLHFLERAFSPSDPRDYEIAYFYRRSG